MPPAKGYIYIGPEVVDFRRDCLTLRELQAKLSRMQQSSGALILGGKNVFVPLVVCERAAKLRGLDLAVAASDFEMWTRTGRVPFSITPKGSSSASTPSSRGKCFIATACYGDPDCHEVLTLRRFRDERLLPIAAGRRLVAWYCRFAPHLAAAVENHPVLRSFLRSVLIRPLVVIVEGTFSRNTDCNDL